jgi:hypothetical protein
LVFTPGWETAIEALSLAVEDNKAKIVHGPKVGFDVAMLARMMGKTAARNDTRRSRKPAIVVSPKDESVKK